jgi:hypothetical protein
VQAFGVTTPTPRRRFDTCCVGVMESDCAPDVDATEDARLGTAVPPEAEEDDVRTVWPAERVSPLLVVVLGGFWEPPEELGMMECGGKAILTVA